LLRGQKRRIRFATYPPFFLYGQPKDNIFPIDLSSSLHGAAFVLAATHQAYGIFLFNHVKESRPDIQHKQEE
jgi:hypothetical protein